jgi:hypothetical protein
MAALLSGGTLRSGSTNTFITLKGAQPQLPATPTTSTGYTIVTSVRPPSELVTTYASSLGNIEMSSGTMYVNVPNTNLQLIGTGTSTVVVSGTVANTGTNSGVLVVQGGLGIWDGFYTGADVNIHGLTVGQGYYNTQSGGGINNITITGVATSSSNNFPNGQDNISIGYNSLQGIDSAYKNIAIGNHAASLGTQLQNTIAIGDRALMNIGTTQTEFAGFISSATQAVPVVLTVVDHTLTSGMAINVDHVLGMTEVNGDSYYAKVLSSSTVALYTDNILGTPLDGRGFSTYTSGGTVSIDVLWNNNFAIGTDAGVNLVNGTENFFVGYKVANQFTTGSYNFFLGHDIAQNMKSGNSNISIGGDNMVDGVDNQVNIGSVFYYNGAGYLQLNADTGVGLGEDATNIKITATISAISTGTQTTITTAQPHGIVTDQVVSITGILGTTQLNNQSFYVRVTSTNTLLLYTDIDLLVPLDSHAGYSSYINGGTVTVNNPIGALSVLGGLAVTENAIIGGPVNILNYIESSSINTGSLTVNGGVGIAGNVNIGRGLTVNGPTDVNISPEGATVYIQPTVGGSVQLYPTVTTGNINNMNIGNAVAAWGTFTNVRITANTSATTLGSGALVVTGGASVNGDLWVGGILHASISGGAGQASNIAGGSAGALVYQVASSSTSFISIGPNNSVLVSNGSNPQWSNTLTITTLNVIGTATSTSTTTGAVTVAGGVGVQGNIYSADGNPLQNYLLYTPKVTVTGTGIPPDNPNIGDFWIDTVAGGQLQFIQDGTSTFWIQITTI